MFSFSKVPPWYMSMQCFSLFIMYIIDRGQQSNPLQPFRHVSLKTDICWFRGCVRLRDYVINGERYLSINEQHEFSYPGIRLMSTKLNETMMCVLQGLFILSFLSWDNTFPWNIKKYLQFDDYLIGCFNGGTTLSSSIRNTTTMVTHDVKSCYDYCEESTLFALSVRIVLVFSLLVK